MISPRITIAFTGTRALSGTFSVTGILAFTGILALTSALAFTGKAARASDVHEVSRTDPVQAGLYRCHQGVQIIVKYIAPDFGSIVVQYKGKDHLLFAVDTATGAVRYQDQRSGITWIKIPSKSMLLDSKLGRQLANDCKL
ncbi:MAG: hypothetical protein RLZZ613_400 [Pseudomonadota bacterium]